MDVYRIRQCMIIILSCVIHLYSASKGYCMTFLYRGHCDKLAANDSITSTFTTFPIGTEPVCSSLAPRGTYGPVAISLLEIIQTHKQSPSNQVSIHSWVERVHVQVECLAQGHKAALRHPRPVSETSRSKVTGHSYRKTTPCTYLEYTCRYRDTEGGHC